jgi:hypothetical protein
MHPHDDTRATPRWSTTSFGDDADTSPAELAALGEHLSGCSAPRRRVDGLHSAAHALQRLVATRFVTTLLLFSLVGALVMAL